MKPYNGYKTKLTYRQLAAIINEQFNDEQKDMDVTIELGTMQEAFAAELRVCGAEHDLLDDYHPVLFVWEP